MKQLSSREKSILIVSFLMISFYLAFNVLYKPLKEISEHSNQEKEKDKRILFKNFKIIHRAEQVSPVYDRYFNLFQQMKTDEEQMSTIISQLESIATEMNFHFSEVKPRKVKKVDFYNIFSVSLAMEGDFPMIMKFFYMLQVQSNFFGVEEIHIRKNLPQDNNLQVSCVITRKLIPQ